jgi:hypothetical protein
MKQLKETPVWMWLIAGLIGLMLGVYTDDISAFIKSWQLGLRGTIS